MMDDLDDSIRDDLARLRASTGPSEDAKQRMWAALDWQLGPGPGDAGPSDAGSGAGGLSQAGFAAKVVAATVGLTGAGLLTLRVGVLAVRMLAPADPVEAEPPQVVDEATLGEHDNPAAPPTEPTVEPAADSANPVPANPVREGQPSSGSRAARVEPARVDNSLTAELASLQAAHDASSPEAALSALDEHQRSFPEGQLTDEREIMRVEALCTLGRLDVARMSAETLLRRRNDLTSRARKVCPALQLEDPIE